MTAGQKKKVPSASAQQLSRSNPTRRRLHVSSFRTSSDGLRALATRSGCEKSAFTDLGDARMPLYSNKPKELDHK